jgi:GMP synthase (glutamine-hydrolysing)
MEADPARIEQWLIGHAAELAAAKIDIRGLRASASSVGVAVAAAGSRAFGHWLDGLNAAR